MTVLATPTPEALIRRKPELADRYAGYKKRGLNLDLTRGKPSKEQLDLSGALFDIVSSGDFRAADGTDCRNYGGLDGIPEAKRLFADYLEVDPGEVIVGGNSSLQLMYNAFSLAMVHGIEPGCPPWGRQGTIRFLCPSPGYDRHFSICEHMGLEMIPVEMTPEGPDMDVVEGLVAEDEAIKGIWCVPKYSNPTGIVYADETVERLATMPSRASDFRIFWDNAYAVHHLTDERRPLKNILAACKAAGNPNRVLIFGSTSKITFPGAGVSMMAGSRETVKAIVDQRFYQTIGPDKLNQLRHVRFLKDMAGIQGHMSAHAAILRPKFDAVQHILDRELGELGIASWSRPAGGYFVSFDAPEGCAAMVIRMAAEAGVKLTPAGSTYPLRKDPADRNIRIAPTFAAPEDIHTAMEVLSVSVQLAAIDRLQI
jgi:aspartate/methionine/tyrosine aminotransferase